MSVSRAERRRARSGRARELFGDDAEVALDVLELAGLAWHDCYREVTPPDAVFEDIWIVSAGACERSWGCTPRRDGLPGPAARGGTTSQHVSKPSLEAYGDADTTQAVRRSSRCPARASRRLVANCLVSVGSQTDVACLDEQ